MKVAAIIPCYKVAKHILSVVEEVLGHVDGVFVVDDKCPEGSGRLVRERFANESLVTVLTHEENQGVGGAMITGYRAALEQGFDICVKLDGDGQMDPAYIGVLIAPILHKAADYTKGNRFYEIEYLRTMPSMRLFGNSILSFVNKFSSGYWNLMDPTNGYTAIHCTALRLINLNKLAKRYFFESDMLFRLYSIRAVVQDIPMPSIYKDEKSNLKISRVALDFPGRYLANLIKRFFYNYILRDLNPATIETIIGLTLSFLGFTYGLYNWIYAVSTGIQTPIGTVVLVALMTIVGLQFLLAALAYDMNNIPKEPLQMHPGLQRQLRTPIAPEDPSRARQL